MVVYAVTTAIGQLTDFSMVNPHKMRNAINFGNAVHKLLELVDRGKNVKSVSEGLLPPLRAWENFKKKHKVDILAVEEPLFSSRYLYAGTLDRVAVVDGVRCIVEIKTRAFKPLTDPLQTAAYLEAWNEMYPAYKVRGRVVVELGASERWCLSQMQEKSQREHFRVFLGSLSLLTWKNSKGGFV